MNRRMADGSFVIALSILGFPKTARPNKPFLNHFATCKLILLFSDPKFTMLIFSVKAYSEPTRLSIAKTEKRITIFLLYFCGDWGFRFFGQRTTVSE
jgi:hypothetical protein